MSDKAKEEEKNKFHREYGPVSNLRYIARVMFGFDRTTAWVITLSAICTPVAAYLWTFMSKFVIDVVTRKDKVENLFIIICITFVIQTVFTLLQSYMWAQWWRYIGVRFHLIIKKNRKFMTMPFEYLEDKDAMDCYQKAGNACGGNDNGVEGLMHLMENSAGDFFVVLVGLFIMGTLSVPVMIGMAVIAFVTFLIRNRTNKVCKAKIWDPLATWWRKDGYLSSTFSDFAFAKDIRMYGLKDYLIKRYKEVSRERLEAQKNNEIRWWICGLLGNVLWSAASLGLYAWLLWSVVNKGLTIGNFSLYLGSAATFFSFTGRLFDRVTELLAKSREVDDFRSFMDIGEEGEEKGVSVPEHETYEFCFEDVWFQYPGAEKYALKNLNLTIKAGEKLAVVGLNGAGKSTFIKLLLRLYEPTKGRILLNGEDISRYDRKEYYRLFSPVFQDVWMFAFPLKANVSMKDAEETDDERVTGCLKDAGMEEAVKELKDGIDTEVLKVVYDDGVDFSGGEKQKIALARALYKNGPVVVLDEPTAALDALAEAKLYEDFNKLVDNRTAVYISHRLSSTRFCDHVAMFVDGEMAEYGTHESLLNAGGAYSEMFQVQAAYYVEGGEEDEIEGSEEGR
ncbi:MAG: ABC transporter ATP-binding protein/permease [Lachnospiraceae bacterium]|nr:ABC transporter ATP-binding protein/permease [Lachnospiraceae bacterium]